MLRRPPVIAALTALLPLAAPTLAQPQVGPGFTFQGRLTQRGQPINGPANLTFRLYDAETGGTLRRPRP